MIIDSGSAAVHFLISESIEVEIYLIVWYESVSDTEGVKGYEEKLLYIPEPEQSNSLTIFYTTTTTNTLYFHQ